MVASSGSAKRGWTLSGSIYQQVIATITSFTRPMERRPDRANKLIPDEETLRDWLLFVLNTNFNGESTGVVFLSGEVENGAGKTDILVRHGDASVFIGECKFWRDTMAALILCIKNKDATKVIEAADACVRAHTQFRDTLPAYDPAARRDASDLSTSARPSRAPGGPFGTAATPITSLAQPVAT